MDPAQVGGYDVVVADAQPAAVFGGDGEFFASGRLDNLSSVHAVPGGADRARGRAPRAGTSRCWRPSTTRRSAPPPAPGPAGPFLQEVLERISAGLGAGLEDRARGYADSLCVSADAGHAVHPNYSERHDPANRPLLGAGPLLKINANQRYATDAVGAALWARLLRRGAGARTRSSSPTT